MPSPPLPTTTRRESRDNAAFPSVLPLGETLPSPPQYARNLPPGQRRLGPDAVIAGPSRVVGFQPLARTISTGPPAPVSTPRSALTSGRPLVKSSTSFADLDPPRDVHDDTKYLHVGDRKMKMVITRGVGPPVGRHGKDGRGKPKRIKVDEVGGRVEGFVEVGKVDGCYELELIIEGRSLCTLYANGQPSMMEGRKLIKKRINLFPDASDTPSSNKSKGKSVESTIPHNTSFAFGFDFPRYCELDDQNSAVDDDDDDEPEKHAVEPSSFGARAMDIQASSSVGSGRRPSMTQQRTSTDDVGSSGFSPSSWKSRVESKSPNFVGKFLKRNSFSASHGSTTAQSPEEEGRRGSFLRRLSTSQSVTRPPLEDRYDLPPSTNLYLGDVQASVEYTVKVKLKRRGMRFNDKLSVMCAYQPVHSVQQLESFVPCPDAVVHPDYPQWQSLTLEGGHQIAHKGQRQDVVEEAGIHAEMTVPFPLLITLPPVASQETGPLPTMPFRFRFHSSLPYQYPLMTFASPETSDWKIRLARRVTIWIHQKEIIRTMPLRNTWKVDAGQSVEGAVEHSARASDEMDESRTERDAQPLATSEPTTTPYREIDEGLATPPPEFAEVYDAPLDIFDPFPPIPDASDDENILVRGKLTLCRVAFKSILTPLNTPDISVEYLLDIEIKPKSGSVKESFGPLKGRFPVMFEM